MLATEFSTMRIPSIAIHKTEVDRSLVKNSKDLVVLGLEPTITRNPPSGGWPLGRITETYPWPDRAEHKRIFKIQCRMRTVVEIHP